MLGKPSLFITFTANPGWQEIRENLRPYETAIDRPDLVSRVFYLKVQAFLEDILHNQAFGVVVGYAWTIEFQKRGLPHIHLLLILRKADAIDSPEAVDRVVSAELPCSDSESEQTDLLHIIKTRQLHGPCGVRNPAAPCMQDGLCTKGYPKAFTDCTTLPEGSYPLYRRRDDYRSANKNDVFLDNRDVVPYNAALSRKYDAHINVEVVSSIKAVKYLYKYTFKGHDRAELELHHDEITNHLNARYVGPAEAAWRLFQFPLYDKSHSVVRLEPKRL